MASGTYAQVALRQPVREALRTRPEALHTREWKKRSALMWLAIPVVGFIAVLVATGALSQHPIGIIGSQGYTVQVGGDHTSSTSTLSQLKTTTVTRLNQTDATQYVSHDQYEAWSASACSAAAMTEIIDAYGYQYHLGDILSVEIALGTISESQGLLSPDGIDQTVKRFGFDTQTLSNPTLQQVLDTANSGKLVLINFPPQPGTIWAGGHFLVLKGGTLDAISLADSSTVNLQTVDQDYMRKYWRGFAKVLTPSSALPSGLSFDKPYVRYAWDAAVKANISPILFVRQINQESGFNPKAVSPAGAIGIAQFMPSTAAGISNPLGSGALDPWNPEDALTAAALYMSAKDQTWEDYAKALAAYNAGNDWVGTAIKRATASGNPDAWRDYLPDETQRYIQIILG